MLVTAQMEFFRKKGFLVLEDIFHESELDSLRKSLDDLVEQGRKLEQSNEFYNLEDFRDEIGRAVPKNIYNLDILSQTFANLVRHPRLLDVISDLIGPDIEFHHMKTNLKLSKNRRGGTEYDWHQDFVYFPHSNFDFLFCMIYLDNSTRKNGCLAVIPESHTWGILDYGWDNYSGPSYDANLLWDSATYIEASAGSLSVHHPLILHASSVNTSNEPRRVILPMYRAADALQLKVLVKTPSAGMLVRGSKSHTVRYEKMTLETSANYKGFYLVKNGRIKKDIAERISPPARKKVSEQTIPA